LNFLRIARITGNTDLEEKAAAIGRAFSSQVSRGPSAFSQLLCAVDFGVGPSYEVVIAGSPKGSDTRAMIEALRGVFAPNKVLLLRLDSDSATLAEIAPFTKNQKPKDGRATAYVCRNHRCKLPTTDPRVMLANLLGKPVSHPEGENAGK